MKRLLILMQLKDSNRTGIEVACNTDAVFPFLKK